MNENGFETKSVNMQRLVEMSICAPEEDIDRIMEHVCQITPLPQTEKYDSNAYQRAPGIERYRPLKGAAAGSEAEVRKRPGVVEVVFVLPDDQSLIERVIEEAFRVHSYEEPVIKTQYTLVSRSKGLDDKNNPYRWWNTTGDWKK